MIRATIERSVTDLQIATEADLDAYLALGVTQMILPMTGPDCDFAQRSSGCSAWRDSLTAASHD